MANDYYEVIHKIREMQNTNKTKADKSRALQMSDKDLSIRILEAMEKNKNITLDELLESNSDIKKLWDTYVKNRARIREREQKMAEKKAILEEKRKTALSKLTDEEIEAFKLTR